jgi:hypothetical protein
VSKHQIFKQQYGPWAFVAGASEGIGQAYAHQLAQRGLNLITCARRLDVLEADAQLLRQRYGVQVEAIALDLAAPTLAADFERALGDKDVGLLVYNACFSAIKPFTEASLAEHHKTVEVNCRGPVVLAHSMVRRLLARPWPQGSSKTARGGIVLMSSMSGFQGSAMVSSYAASKAFNTILAESLWAELQPQGISVLACVAGATLTPGFESSTPKEKQKQVFPMRPAAVAAVGLGALGKGRPVVIAGGINRLVNAFSALMTRRQRTAFFSSQTQKVYRS